YRWELAVHEPLGGGRANEWLVKQAAFADATGPVPAHLTSDELPFALDVGHFLPNCRPMPKGPMFDVHVPVVDGVFLNATALDKEAEHNIAGAYVSVLGTQDGTRQDGMVWGAEAAPWTVVVGGRTFTIDLRHERYPMPYTIALEKFT